MAIKFLNTVAVDTDVLYVDATNNRVGIGIDYPSAKLHVNGNIELSANFEIGSNNGSYWQRIRTEDSSSLTANAFNFETRNGSGSFLNHLTILNNGNVGIGINNPGNKLDVDGITTSLGFRTPAATTDYSLISRESAGNSPLYVQSANTSANQTLAKFNYGSTIANGGTNVLTVAKDNSYFINTNLGIGTANPSDTLHVSGNLRLTGAFKDSSGDSGTSGQILSSTGSGTNWINNTAGGVTSVAATNGIAGGTITSTGTIQVDSTVVRTTGNQTIAGVKTFSSDIRFNNDILDSSGSTGTVGQVLIATQQGAVSWVNQSDNFITAATFNAGSGVITGTGSGGAGFTVDISGLNADKLDGYHASTTRNAANTIPIRDANGYLKLGWINTTSGNTTSTISDIYVNTNDGYIRKSTPAHFRSQITDGNYLPAANPTFTGTLTGSSVNITGNTFLGNSNGDYVHVNDTLFVGATDSGNSEFWFGEGTTGDVNYGAHWHWDSGYTHKWFTVNNSSETLMMSYATNDTSKVNWYRDIDIQDNDIVIDTSHGFVNSGPWTRNKTPSGYIDFGPANAGHAHIYTDRPNFYFNKQLLVSGNTVWNAGNDGSGSGLDADLLDGQEGTYYLDYNNFTNTPTQGDITSVGAGTGMTGGGSSGGVTLNVIGGSGITANANNITVDSTVVRTTGTQTIAGVKTFSDDVRFNNDIRDSSGSTGTVGQVLIATQQGAVSWVNQSYGVETVTAGTNLNGGGTSGTVTLNLDTSISLSEINIGQGVQLKESTDRADLLQITSYTSSWAGLQIRNSSNEGRWSLMTDGASSGFYDDENNDWAIQVTENSAVRLYHNNYQKLSTTSAGISVSGYVSINDNIAHNGDGNTYIGFPANDTFRIVTAGVERLRVNSSGRIGIGTTNPQAALHIDNPQTGSSNIGFLLDAPGGGMGAMNMKTTIPSYGTGIRIYRGGSYASNAISFYNGNSQVGGITINTSSTSYSTTSDYRSKENVVPMENSISRLKELKPCRFNFLTNTENTVDGFIAHEAQEVVPEAVTGEKDQLDHEGNPDFQGIDQSKLVPLLTSALQEAISKIEQLEIRIQTLENN